MEKLKGLSEKIALVTKYVAIAVAFAKALEVFNDEFKKIVEPKPKQEDAVNE